MVRNLYVCAPEYLAVASQPTPTTLLLGIAYMYYNTENSLQALNNGNRTKITTTATTKIDTTIRTFKGRLFKDSNDDILDETLTTMEST